MLPGVHVPVVQAALGDRAGEGHLDHAQVRDAEYLQDAGGTWYRSLISSAVMSASAMR
jgi:hypothetical protein